MEFDVSAWIPSFITMAVSFVGGAVAALRVTGQDRASATQDTRLQDIDERMGHLVAQLKDLETQRDGLEPKAYQAQKKEFEELAARALKDKDRIEQEINKQRDKRGAPAAAKKRQGAQDGGEQQPGLLAANPQLKGALWGGGAAIVLGFVVVTLFWEGSTEPAQGAATPAQQSETNPEVRALLTRLHSNPTDIQAMSRLGHVLLEAQRPQEATVITERALQLDPGHAESRVHAAVIRGRQGDQEGAIKALEGVVKDHPDLVEGWLFLGMECRQAGISDRMRESFEQYIARAPDGPLKEKVRGLLKQAEP